MQQIRDNVARTQAQQFLKSAGFGNDEERKFGTSHKEQVRLRVHKITDNADFSWEAWAFANFVVGCIVISVVAFCLETVPALEFKYQEIWFNLEVFMVGVFTTEFVSRLWASPKTWSEFFLNFFNIIDVMSILPFYIYLVMSAVSPVDLFVLRVFRLFRLIQILKMARYSKMLSLIVRALHDTLEIIVVLLCMMMIAIILYASLMWMAEQGVWDEAQGCYVRPTRPDLGCSPFDSVPASFYWGVTTLTGVGYGDHYPVTPWGKAIACAAMVTGILALALPVVLIGVHMSNTMVFLKSEIDSKKTRRINNEDLFNAVVELDAICLRVALMGEECQRLALGSCACKLRRERGGDEAGYMEDVVTLAKPVEILSNRMLARFMDLKKYVNAVDVNDHDTKEIETRLTP